MEMRRRQPIGVELVKRGVITEQDIVKALDYQRQHPNMKLGDIIHILNVCDENVLIKNIGEILGIKGMVISRDRLKLNPTDYMSLDICKKYKCIPVEIEGTKIKVCFSDKILNTKTDPVKLLLLNQGLVMDEYITFEKDI